MEGRGGLVLLLPSGEGAALLVSGEKEPFR